MGNRPRYIRWFEDLSNEDVPQVGGKNASLGEMIRSLKRQGVKIPDGFATTAQAYRAYLRENQIEDTIRVLIDEGIDSISLNPDSVIEVIEKTAHAPV